MPIRFSTEAANEDKLQGDAQPPTRPGTPTAAGEASAAAKTGDRPPQADPSGKPGNGKPGKDINAAGFIKNRDADKP